MNNNTTSGRFHIGVQLKMISNELLVHTLYIIYIYFLIHFSKKKKKKEKREKKEGTTQSQHQPPIFTLKLINYKLVKRQ